MPIAQTGCGSIIDNLNRKCNNAGSNPIELFNPTPAMNVFAVNTVSHQLVSMIQTDRQRGGRQTDRQTETDRDKETETWRDRERQRGTNTHTHTHTHTHTRTRRDTLTELK